MHEKNKKTTRRASPLLWGGLAAFALVVLAGAYALLSDVPGERPSGSGERPYVGGDLHSLAVDPTDPERVMVGGHDGGAISNDSGKTWRQASGLEGADPMGWVVDPSDPRIVYAGALSESGVILFRSGDGGESWETKN